MKLLPWRRIEIESGTTAEELAASLARNVGPPRWFSPLPADHAPFEGNLTDGAFRIWRAVDYFSLWEPVIRGEIRAKPPRSVLVARMRLESLALGYFVFGLLVLPISAAARTIRYGSALAGLAGVAVATVWLWIFSFLFKSGADRAEALLEEIVKRPSQNGAAFPPPFGRD